MSSKEPLKLAKLTWTDPETQMMQEFILVEGATAGIGRSSNNDICVPDRHVSRQHAIISYRDGLFMINDLKSANGTFVNDVQLTDEFPLASGDIIRLYIPTMLFSAVVSDDEARRARETGTIIGRSISTGKGRLIITNGPQEDHVIPLLLEEITVGRATSKATWEIGLQDPAVSRPHARFKRSGENWLLYDLGSSNGTYINDEQLFGTEGRQLNDGDRIIFGGTLIVYRAG